MDAAQDIKAKLSIEDVVGEYVRLKRAGRNFKGLSPFTPEKTPSFVVSPEKQIWHDFSSNRGGDLISFVMEAEGLDFKAALELLARKAGVDLTQYQSNTNKGSNKDVLYKILEEAARFYHGHLRASALAKEYLSSRNFSDQTIIDFQIGYSPNKDSALIDHLVSKGYGIADIKKAGLVSSYNGRTRDMFRGRIMIPLHDGFGRVIGFTARIVDATKTPNAPKYINTPATLLYDKSRHVYGLHLAKQAIKSEDAVIIVEGNLDVISSHQAGVKQVVAIAGTALTAHQAKSLAGFTENIRLCFDQDRAGIQATERSLEIISKLSVNLCVITISSGKDPDELINKDATLWLKAIDEYQPALEWLLELYKATYDTATATGKRKFGEYYTRALDKLADPIEKEHYIALAAQKTGISSTALMQTASMQQNNNDTPTKKIKMKDHSDISRDAILLSKLCNQWITLMMCVPGTRRFARDIEPSFMYTDEQKVFLKLLHEQPTIDLADKKHPTLSQYEDYVKIIVVTFEELFQNIEALELEYEAEKLKNNILETFVRNRKKQISIELEKADEQKERMLLEESSNLDKILTNKKAQ